MISFPQRQRRFDDRVAAGQGHGGGPAEGDKAILGGQALQNRPARGLFTDQRVQALTLGTGTAAFIHYQNT